jgi:hypothetical protein
VSLASKSAQAVLEKPLAIPVNDNDADCIVFRFQRSSPFTINNHPELPLETVCSP